MAATLHQQSAEKYARAQAYQLRPTIRAIGTVGDAPIRPGRYFISGWDGAVGLDIKVPGTDGFSPRSKAREAQLQALSASQQARQVLDRVTREVEIAWLKAQSSFQRRNVTAQMLGHAERSLALATSQYQLGLTSYMELSRAEMQQADARVADTDADYAYRLASAVLRCQVGSAQ